MKTINAVFKGKNRSLGYVNGIRYDLEMHQSNNSPEVTIKRLYGRGKCVYSNLTAFLENWKDISTVFEGSKMIPIVKEMVVELKRLYEMYGHQSTGELLEKIDKNHNEATAML